MSYVADTRTDLERLFDVALYGHVRGTGIPVGVAKQLETAADAIAPADFGPDLSLLRRVLEHLEFRDERSDPSSVNWAEASRLALARAVAAGLPIDGTGLDVVGIARDCSLYLDRCDYVNAARELTILAGLVDGIDATEFGPEIRRFAGQAWDYLETMSRIVGSRRLEWECDLYRRAIAGRP